MFELVSPYQPAGDQPEDRLAKLGSGHDRAGDGEHVADHGVPERPLVLLLRRLAHLRVALLHELAVRLALPAGHQVR